MLPQSVQALIQLALAEDIGRGDATSAAVLPPGTAARAVVLVKEDARVAGLPVVAAVFHAVDPGVVVTPLVAEGADVAAGTAVCRVEGDAIAILGAERTALNFLARLTGIATLTRSAVAQLAGTKAKLLDTRKTTPGWRYLEKYAVRVGGGMNHRFGLDDMILIKDNHIALAGGVRAAVARARAHAGLAQKIEVEVETIDQLREALASGADLILLDNMDLATMRQAVAEAAGRVPLEASGNMTLDRLAAVAATGVDYISMGALTHSATSIDVSLDVELAAPGAGG
ncbi:nicotinate-nucleotide diphosphorylase (carboxylating) [Alicyclobacillus cellulosilyticus]|uniref:Probable nicotinate-nucleotide pyrophosphorylase [carboxylating] n=1 Tax=Alicyclobacillus cellulosilyticus TaxID=1003997 RepID=A0A917KFR4_9BACL|nr:carboxylating nicotinate-nucleotide diphosphorylase [Alicyclobacillus cellulosilyticus]GGJ11940.1 nicotinate-nucleotide diphosphorylase (carboxylating) [Alicyclobacillus cellulosilyticus]